MKTAIFSAISVSFLALSGPAFATTLSAALNVDNTFTAYISTDDSVAGTQFLSGTDWPTTYNGSAALTDGVTNYLHIMATDLGAPAMLLGTFSLSDANFSFANGTQSLFSGDAGLLVSESGWGGYGATVNLGPNGTGPWGFRGTNAAADYVWSANVNNTVYFTAAITYDVVATVPVPAALPMLALGLGGLGIASRRRK